MNATPNWCKFNYTRLPIALVLVATFFAWTIDNTSSCKQGWTKWNKMCYKLSQKKGNWNTSQSTCLTQGANLASLESEEEYSFVLSLMNAAKVNQVWIGLNDIQTQGVFKWVDKKPYVFTNITIELPHMAMCCVEIKADVKEWSRQFCELFLKGLCKYVDQEAKEDFSVQEYYTRQQLYNSVQNKLLLNHVVKRKSVPSLLHCSSICLEEAKCMSLNYKTPQDPQFMNGLCLLNSATADDFPEDYVDNSAYIYALPIK